MGFFHVGNVGFDGSSHLVVLAAFLGFCSSHAQSRCGVAFSHPVGSESADARIQDFTFTQTKGDLVQWKVQAEQARLYEKRTALPEQCADHHVRCARKKN